MSNLFEQMSPVRDTWMNSFIEKITKGIKSWGLDTSSDQFYRMMNDIVARSRVTKVFPTSTKIFRAFEECKELKVVFVGQDPYYQTGIADGLAFSCGLTLREQPSLKFIFDEIQRTAYHYSFLRNPDLTRWANQGILLMNTALTVEYNKPDSHTDLWKPWIESTLRTINRSHRDIIFVFFGKRAQGFMHLIGPHNQTLKVVHPAAAAHRGGVWDSEGIFVTINQLLSSYNKEEIIW